MLLDALHFIDKNQHHKISYKRLKALAFYNIYAYDDAVNILEELVNIDAFQNEDLNNLCLIYPLIGRSNEAVDIAQQLLARDLKNPYYWENMGYAFFNEGNYKQALESYKRAGVFLQIDKITSLQGRLDFRGYHVARLLHDHELAYQLLCHRLNDEAYTQTLYPPVNAQHQPLTLWKGQQDHQSLQHQTILIWRENTEGVGDDILTLQYLSQMPKIFFEHNHYIVTIDKRLYNIATSLLPYVDYITHEDSAPYIINKPIDIVVLSLQLPYYLWHHHIPTLTTMYQPTLSQKDSIKNIRDVLQKQFPQKKLIGFSWRTKNKVFAYRRSIPPHELHILNAVDNMIFINLQYDTSVEECSQIPNLCYIDNIDCQNDFDNNLLLIQALDGVITTSNTVADMAGLVGVPTCLLAPKAGVSRWCNPTIYSDIYPNMVVFRQQEWGRYQDVLWASFIYMSSYQASQELDFYCNIFENYGYNSRENEPKLSQFFFKVALLFNPETPVAHGNLAWITYEEQDYEQTILHCQCAIDQYQDKSLYYLYSESARQTKKYQEHVDLCEIAQKLFPDDEYFIGTYAESLVMTNQGEKALEHYKKYLDKPEATLKLKLSYVSQLEKLGYIEQAITTTQTIEQEHPEAPELINHKLNLLFNQGYNEQYCQEWQKYYAIDTVPTTAVSEEPYIFCMFAYIAQKNWDDAEKLEKLRWKISLNEKANHTNPFQHIEPFPYKTLEPNELKGKKIIFWLESIEGIGDIFFHARWFPYLIEHGAHLILVGDSRFNILASRLYKNAIMTISEDFPYHRAQKIQADYELSGLKIFIWGMKYIGLHQHQLPYFKSDPIIQEQILKAIAKNWRGKKLVGLSWRTMNPHFITKRVTELKYFKELFLRDDIVVINIQYGDNQQEIQQFCTQYKVIFHEFEYLDIMNNFNALTSVFLCLDYFISMDNSTAIMGGCLYKPGSLLLNYVPNYRWFDDTEYSCYYPTLKIHKQTHILDWTTPINQAIQSCFHYIDTNAS